jgi:hypothetical protein
VADDWTDYSRPRDAYVLLAASRVLRRRSTRPKSFWLGVICRILESTASRIEEGHDEQ